MSRKYTLLVNPFANGGRAGHRVDVAARAIARVGSVSVEHTRNPGDEPRIIQHAIDSGSHAMFVLGGDGTVSHAARAIVKAGASIPIAILAAGTGNDFAKSLGAPVHDYDAIASLVADNAVRTIDVGRVDDYVFANSAGFGFDARVQEETKKPTRLSGNAVYLKAALSQLFQYRGFRAQLAFGDTRGRTAPSSRSTGLGEANLDAAKTRDDHWLMLVFANGRYFGGMFNIAPDAKLDDGALDAISLMNASPLSRIRLFADAMRGAHVNHPKVHVTRAPHFTLDFDQPPAFEADGELRLANSSRVEIGIVPNALRVVAP